LLPRRSHPRLDPGQTFGKARQKRAQLIQAKVNSLKLDEMLEARVHPKPF